MKNQWWYYEKSMAFLDMLFFSMKKKSNDDLRGDAECPVIPPRSAVSSQRIRIPTVKHRWIFQTWSSQLFSSVMPQKYCLDRLPPKKSWYIHTYSTKFRKFQIQHQREERGEGRDSDKFISTTSPWWGLSVFLSITFIHVVQLL